MYYVKKEGENIFLCYTFDLKYCFDSIENKQDTQIAMFLSETAARNALNTQDITTEYNILWTHVLITNP